jgi:hypothetical protein
MIAYIARRHASDNGCCGPGSEAETATTTDIAGAQQS